MSLLSLLLPHCTAVKSPPVFPWGHPMGTGGALRSPQSHLCWRLNKPSFPSLSSQGRCSISPTILLAPHWAGFCFSISVLYWGAQNWRQYPGVVWVLGRGDSPFPQSLFVQPRLSLATFAPRTRSWPMCHLLRTRTPRVFPPQLLFRKLAPGCTHSKKIPSQGQDFAHVLVEFQPIHPACPCPSGWQPCPGKKWLVPPVWYQL